MLVGIRDNCDLDRRNRRKGPPGHCEANAVHRDRSLRHDVAGEIFGHAHSIPPIFTFGPQMRDLADSIDMAENKVATEFLAGREGLLQIHARSQL